MQQSDKIKIIVDNNDRLLEQKVRSIGRDASYDPVQIAHDIDLFYDRSLQKANQQIQQSCARLERLVDLFYGEGVHNKATCDIDQLVQQLGIVGYQDQHQHHFGWKDASQSYQSVIVQDQSQGQNQSQNSCQFQRVHGHFQYGWDQKNGEDQLVKEQQIVKESHDKIRWSSIVNNIKKKQSQQKSMQCLQEVQQSQQVLVDDQKKKQIDQQLNCKLQNVQKNQDLQRTLQLNEYFKQLDLEIIQKPLTSQEQSIAIKVQSKLHRYDTINLNGKIGNKLQQLLDQNKVKFSYKLQIWVKCFENVYEFIKEVQRQSQVHSVQLNNYVYSLKIELYDDQMCVGQNSERMVHVLSQLRNMNLCNVVKFTLILYYLENQDVKVLIELVKNMHYLERIEFQFEDLKADLESQKRLYSVMHEFQKLKEIYLKLGQEWKENKDDDLQSGEVNKNKRTIFINNLIV